MKKKQHKWVRRRHAFFKALVYPFVWLIARRKYGMHVERFRSQGRRAYLVLYNHQTPFDQFFVELSFSRQIYHVASEDLFSNGFLSSLLRFTFAPIPIVKSTTDLRAVKTCLRVAKEGGTISMAPEGNRTYSGKTEHINPAVSGLAKKLGLPIALFRIEGGYGVQPRWSDVTRKGTMHAYVSRVIEPEEYAAMSADALFSEIRDGLFIDEGRTGGTFVSDRRAEYLERAVYVCPTCGLSTFESNGCRVVCLRCGRTVEYGEDKTLSGVGFEFPYRTVSEWYDRQADFVRRLDLSPYTDEPMYTDRADLYEVILNRKKKLLEKDVAVRLFGDRIELNTGGTAQSLPFADTQAAVLGRNKLNLYSGGHVYQLKGAPRFNALKYVQICYHGKNIGKGNEDGQFLGL